MSFDSCVNAMALILMLVIVSSDNYNECSAISQITSTVLMIPPNNRSITFDPETAGDNKFMQNIEIDLESLLIEWNEVVDSLQENGIQVIIPSHHNDSHYAPNALFPNNWLSSHSDLNALAIYPMKAQNRRLEIRHDILIQLQDSLNYEYIHDMTSHVDDDLFLEGTGALVLDRQFKIAYMSISERASSQLAIVWAKKFKYQLILFESIDINMNIIYHTNIMMSVGSTYVIICIQCIKTNGMREFIKNIIINESKKEIIEITQHQMIQFCGNVLEVGNFDNKLLMMSYTAYNGFTEHQKNKLINDHSLKLIYPNVSKIETMFGGGVRCMIAELFPPMICENQ